MYSLLYLEVNVMTFITLELNKHCLIRNLHKPELVFKEILWAV